MVNIIANVTAFNGGGGGGRKARERVLPTVPAKWSMGLGPRTGSFMPIAMNTGMDDFPHQLAASRLIAGKT